MNIPVYGFIGLWISAYVKTFAGGRRFYNGL